MNEETVEKLSNLNKEFYKKVAPVFDRTRSYCWKGWTRLVPVIKQRFPALKKLRVLDVGCGNGRFGPFLKERLKIPIEYTGIDSNFYLLERAREKLSGANLIESDILSFDYSSLKNEFDLIALFGVLHHIPRYENRLMLLENLGELLSAKGFLAFSTWDFLKSPVLRKRIQPWSKIGLENQIDENDYLLNWEKGVQAFRYCHSLTDEEVVKLCSESSLKILKTYSSNARGDRYNKYFITSL